MMLEFTIGDGINCKSAQGSFWDGRYVQHINSGGDYIDAYIDEKSNCTQDLYAFQPISFYLKSFK